MSTTTAILVLVLLLAGNAFFVAAEFALISVRRDQVEPLAQQGKWSAKTTLDVLREVNLVIAGTQLGITACSLGIGAVGEPAIAHALEGPFAAIGIPTGLVHPIALVIALLIVVYLHMVLGEMVPKNIALAGALRASLILGPIMYVICWVIRPFLWLMNATAGAVLKLMKVEPKDEVAAAFDREQVRAFVEDSGREGLLDEDEFNLLAGALDFETLTAADVALPSETLRTVPRTITIRELEQISAETGYSRFPVEEPDGGLTGYVHVKDVLGVPADERDLPIIDRFLNPLPAVPADAGLRDVVARMQRSHAHLARLDGATGGAFVIALEDVLEELVGEVRDATSPTPAG